MAFLVAGIGLATLGEYLFGWRLEIDELLFRDHDSVFTAVRGRMSPLSTVAFVAMGSAIAALPQVALRRVILPSAALTFAIGAVSLLGYIWEASELTSDQWLPPVAIHTALAFILISAGTALVYRAQRRPSEAGTGRVSGHVENKVLLGFLTALALLCVGGGITYRMGVEFASSAQSITRTQEVRAALKDLYIAIADAESAQRNYLLIGSQEYRTEYQLRAAKVALKVAALQQLLVNEPTQAARLRDLTEFIAERMQLLDGQLEALEAPGSEAVRSDIATDNGVTDMKLIRDTIFEMDRAEESILTTRTGELGHQRSETLIALLATLAIATATLLMLFGSIVADIRERARIMKALDQAQIDSQRASQAKSEFLAAMSHEIRTPMNGVIGMIEVLQQSSLMGQQLEMVGLIRESADSLLTIIDDILDFSKIEAGRMDLEALPLSVAEVVEKTAGLLNRLAERKGTTLTVYVDPALPNAVVGDAARLRQILINLTNNAIKFSSGLSRPGRVSVRAMLGARQSGRVVVEFRVVDNGIGMDQATLGRLFDAFAQADLSTTRRYGGTGLGLAISKRLASLMGGDISVHTRIDEGSTFTLRVPFVLPSQPAQSNEPRVELDGLTCLVVGAKAGMADDLASYLASDDATVARVPDLVRAREWTESHPRGLAVWVIDAGEYPPGLDELQGSIRQGAESSPKVVLVVVGRGQRRSARAEADGIIMIDGNALTRETLRTAVAIAAGRMPAEAELLANRRGTMNRPPTSREEALRQRRLILVAEDNAINQRVIGHQLSLLGYAADIVDSGREAFLRWQSGDYALLLTDLHMPETDGYDLTLAIRCAEGGRSRTPVIALTANAIEGEAERCRGVGMDDYLSKPATLIKLAAALERWLPAAASTTAAASKPVDISALEALIGTDRMAIRGVLRDFGASVTVLAAELSSACAAQQAATSARVAHKLKSSARAVGALQLGELCAAIEEAGNAGNLTRLTDLVAGFEVEVAAVQDYLGSSFPCDSSDDIRRARTA